MKHLSGYPYGETLRNISVPGFTLTETAYNSTLKLPKHSHEQAYFCFVLGGSFTEIYGKRSRSCRPSTLIFHPAREIHSDQFHTSTRCFNVQLNARWLEGDLGSKRFEQLGKKITLTEAGQLLVPYATRIIAAMSDLHRLLICG